PLVACGQTKRPRSSRLANRHNPSPSCQRTLIRSPRRPRNTNTCPENGFCSSLVSTSALSPVKPRRKSVPPAAIQIRVLAGSATDALSTKVSSPICRFSSIGRYCRLGLVPLWPLTVISSVACVEVSISAPSGHDPYVCPQRTRMSCSHTSVQTVTSVRLPPNEPGLKLFDSAVNCLRRSSSHRKPWSLYVSIDPRFSAPRSTNAFRAIPGSHSKVLHAFTDEAIV